MANKKAKRSGKQTRLTARLRAVAPRYLARAAVLALLVVALCLAAARAWTAVSDRPEFILDSTALSFRHCPPAARADYMIKQLRNQLTVALGRGSIFEADLCSRVERQLRTRCFWVREVKGVRRLMPRKLEVDLVFRQPAALVQFGSYSYMVDMDGYWLPDALYDRTEVWKNESVAVIVNRKLRGAPPIAKPWDGPSLAAGIRLYDFLRKARLFDELAVKTIDVTRVGANGFEPDIVLVTQNGVTIKWGCSDGYAQLDGLSLPSWAHPDSQKLEMLRAKLKDYPGLKGLDYIDLRFAKLSIIHPSAGPSEEESVSRPDSRSGPRRGEELTRAADRRL